MKTRIYATPAVIGLNLYYYQMVRQGLQILPNKVDNFNSETVKLNNFTDSKMCLTTATHNFTLVKITHICLI